MLKVDWMSSICFFVFRFLFFVFFLANFHWCEQRVFSIFFSLSFSSLSLYYQSPKYQAQGSEIELKNELEQKQQQLNIANFDRESIIKKMEETETTMNELQLQLKHEHESKNQMSNLFDEMKKTEQARITDVATQMHKHQEFMIKHENMMKQHQTELEEHEL